MAGQTKALPPFSQAVLNIALIIKVINLFNFFANEVCLETFYPYKA